MDICILNSGFGSRLKKYTEHMPKGMVPIHGSSTILSRQLAILSSTGTHRYCITTGYLDGKIQEYVGREFPNLVVDYYPNTRYASTNYITSMDLLYPDCQDEIILMHGDLVFELSVAQDILASRKSIVVVDSSLPLPEKDFKARVENGRVIEIGIDVFGPDCYACQPLYHLRKQDWNIWQLEIQEFCKNGNESVYAENALNEVSTTMELYPFDVAGRLCMEIDNEADLETAKQLLEKP